MPTDQRTTHVNPVDVADHADRLIVKHPGSYGLGRCDARDEAGTRSAETYGDARVRCAHFLRRGSDSNAAYWLGYADELAEVAR